MATGRLAPAPAYAGVVDDAYDYAMGWYQWAVGEAPGTLPGEAVSSWDQAELDQQNQAMLQNVSRWNAQRAPGPDRWKVYAGIAGTALVVGVGAALAYRGPR